MSANQDFKNGMANLTTFMESIHNRFNLVEKRLDSVENTLKKYESSHSELAKRIESIENKSTRQYIPSSHSTDQIDINSNSKESSLIVTIEETQYDDNNDNTVNNELTELNQDDDLLDITIHPSISSIDSTNIIQHKETLAQNINHHNHDNHNMPILEPATEIQLQKENVVPNAMQLFGLQTLQTQNEDNNNNTNNKVCNDDSIDLDVLFSLFESMTSLASKSMKQNDFQTALEHFRDALDELNKYIPDLENIPLNRKHIVSVAYCNRGICYGKLSQWNNALIAVNKCISIAPNWHKAYSTLGSIYTYQNKYDKAIKAYEKALNLCTLHDLESKNKIQRRYKSLLEHKQNANRNNKRRLSNTSLDESPAKRRRINTNRNERMDELKDKLQNKTVSELGIMLEINGQKKSGRKAELIARVCDGIINGAIPKCPKCNNKFLKYNAITKYYSCGGSFDIETHQRIPCGFNSKLIVRTPWISGIGRKAARH